MERLKKFGRRKRRQIQEENKSEVGELEMEASLEERWMERQETHEWESDVCAQT